MNSIQATSELACIPDNKGDVWYVRAGSKPCLRRRAKGGEVIQVIVRASVISLIELADDLSSLSIVKHQTELLP